MHFIIIVLVRRKGRKEIKSGESDKDLTQTFSKSANISAAKECIMNKINYSTRMGHSEHSRF